MSKCAVFNPTKHSKVTSAQAATKKLPKVQVITFACHPKRQTCVDTGTMPAGIAVTQIKKHPAQFQFSLP